MTHEIKQKIEEMFPRNGQPFGPNIDNAYRREGAEAMAELLWPCVDALNRFVGMAPYIPDETLEIQGRAALKKAGLE